MQLDVVGHVPPDMGRRRLEAEDLLDRVRDEGAVLDELAPLVGVLGEDLSRPADQAGRRLVPAPATTAM